MPAMTSPGVVAMPRHRHVVAALILLFLPVAQGALRASVASKILLQRNAHQDLRELRNDTTLTDIKEKWDKMDEFLEIIFTLGCKWQHGRDVEGVTAEKLKNGEIRAGEEVSDSMAQTQAENAQMFKRACGMIVASGEKKCRQSCADRWGQAATDRDSCDEKCVSVYDRFESQCLAKVSHLEKVYSQKMQAIAGRQQCYKGHCALFPTVWMKQDVSAMESERDSRCQVFCTANQVELRCTRKWQLEADLIESRLASECHGASEVSSCFSGKKAAASSAQTSCVDDGLSICTSQHTACMDAGRTASFAQVSSSSLSGQDPPRKAQEFCNERRKMCQTQVNQHCLENFTDALEKAKKECHSTGGDALEQCTQQKMETAKTQYVSDCVSESTPKCTKDCQAKCKVDAMSTCLGNLKSEHDPTKDFCSDLWNLLHESSEVDPVTGDPIVLLAPASPAVVAQSRSRK